ncbi:MAG: hypothetical protein ACLFVT_09540 [Syntrophobacteria bacterium]
MRRDAYILGVCSDLKVPAAIVLGGGYARNTQDTVDIHLNTVKVAVQLMKRWNEPET